MWKFTKVGKDIKLKNPVLIAGLPGIGNVGKIAADYLVENLEADMIYEIFSYSFPNSVFVKEDNLIELISMSIHHKKINGRDILFLIGDVQPTDEQPSYEFCAGLLDILKEHGCSEIITIGGIGLADMPKKPKVYITGNSKAIVEKYRKGTKMKDKLYGVVGPIIGVSGLLLGLGQKRDIDAVCLLAETFGHPMYLGVMGAREILIVLSKKLNLKIDFKTMDTEIKDMESDLIKRITEIDEFTKNKAVGDATNYIG